MPDDLNAPIDLSAVSVAATATALLSGVTEVGGKPFKGFFVNPTDGEIAIGGSTVTAATGMLVSSGEKIWIDWSRGTNWYAIRTGGANVNVRVLPVK